MHPIHWWSSLPWELILKKKTYFFTFYEYLNNKLQDKYTGLKIRGCSGARDFAPITDIFKARCLAGTGQKRLSSNPDIYQGTVILGREPRFFNLGARQATAKNRLSSSPEYTIDPNLYLIFTNNLKWLVFTHSKNTLNWQHMRTGSKHCLPRHSMREAIFFSIEIIYADQCITYRSWNGVQRGLVHPFGRHLNANI